MDDSEMENTLEASISSEFGSNGEAEEDEIPDDLEPEEVKAYLEAALMVSTEPMTAADMSEFFDYDGRRIRSMLKELKQEYDESGRGFQLIKVAGGFKMTTRSRHYPFLKKLFGEQTLARLSDAAIETLVIVAYHQPITRSEAEAIRGVNCQSVLNTLLEKNFIRISGRRDEIGRPIEYSTTDRFLDYFGLNSLNDLPDEDEIESLINE
ncbi:MAG: SMC-Scp complex subunit ScpB [bacterium]